MAAHVTTSSREARRLLTRERILGAAIAEFAQSGMAGADVGAIVAAAGVAHGTFYFHFPTKEHVLLELESREEHQVAAAFARFLDEPHDLASALTEIARLLMGLERKFGKPLFKEILALHLSPARPQNEDWTDHPVIVQLVREIEQSRSEGKVHPEVDAFYNAVFFLLGIHGVLSTTDSTEVWDTVSASLIASTVRGLVIR
jgi:TetR/AcrR family transcriptional regulator, repressor for uid operon